MTLHNLEKLIFTLEKLRGPDGCPWDKEQTHQSIVTCLIEEVSELIETIDNQDMNHMKEELGDVLLHILFHASIANTHHHFNIDDVAKALNEKLIRRHPHVFEDAQISTMDELWVQWEKIKKEEKGHVGQNPTFKHLPPKLPSLLYATEVYKQIKKAKLDEAECFKKQDTEELEFGRKLFELVISARNSNIDPETALRKFSDHLKTTY